MPRRLWPFLVILLVALCLQVTTAYALQPEIDLVRHAVADSDADWFAIDYGQTFRLGDLSNTSNDKPASPPALTSAELTAMPACLDWRDIDGQNYVSPIKSQGDCGSCWAFAAVGALESQYALVHQSPGTFLDLSEQILVSCCTANSGCDGGYASRTASFMVNAGTYHEACYPYLGEEGDCSSACSEWPTTAIKASSALPVSQSLIALKQALQDGPIQCSMDVYSDFNYYGGGVYEMAWGVKNGGHAITLVGYCDDPEARWDGGYLIGKNSWGAAWGESGFFRIGYSQITNLVRFGRDAYRYTVEPQTLKAPTDLVVTDWDADEITIGWTDQSSGETGFRIYRWNGLKYAAHDTVSANVTHYTDSALDCDTAYYYVVCAYNGLSQSDTTDWVGQATSPCAEGCVTPPLCDDLDLRNDTTQTAMRVPVVVLGASPDPVDACFDSRDDVDWFWFYALADQTYTVAALAAGAQSDPVLALYAADGVTELANANEQRSGMGESLQWTPEVSDHLLVRVTEYTGRCGRDTDYALDVSVSPTAVRIALDEGWNLVSSQLMAVDPAPGAIFATLGDSLDLAYAYGGDDADPWQIYYSGLPDTLQEIRTVCPWQGLWLHLNQQATWSVTGAYTADWEVDTEAGWVLWGQPFDEDTPVAAAFAPYGAAPLPSQIDTVQWPGPSAASGQWLTYSNDGDSSNDDFDTTTPGQAYWLRLNDSYTWRGPGTEPPEIAH